jgi:hypothetical protein
MTGYLTAVRLAYQHCPKWDYGTRLVVSRVMIIAWLNGRAIWSGWGYR